MAAARGVLGGEGVMELAPDPIAAAELSAARATFLGKGLDVEGVCAAGTFASTGAGPARDGCSLCTSLSMVCSRETKASIACKSERRMRRPFLDREFSIRNGTTTLQASLASATTRWMSSPSLPLADKTRRTARQLSIAWAIWRSRGLPETRSRAAAQQDTPRRSSSRTTSMATELSSPAWLTKRNMQGALTLQPLEHQRDANSRIF